LWTLLQDNELRARFGESGRKAVEAEFNVETNAAIIVEYLKKSASKTFL
jgi:glycosyltransferase involved in cell wall biosynthesis